MDGVLCGGVPRPVRRGYTGSREWRSTHSEDRLKAEEDDLTYYECFSRMKINRLGTLVESPGGERSCWTQNAKAAPACYEKLTGDVIVACGLVACLGVFVPGPWESPAKHCVKLPKTPNITGSEAYPPEV